MSDRDQWFLPNKAPEPPEALELTLDAGLPANVDAETTILGAILLDNAAHAKAAEKLEPEDFSLDSHRRIFQRMTELIESGHHIDIVTLSGHLSRFKEVESVGGVAYLASLTEGLPRRPVIEEYIRIVKDKSLLRKIMGICSVTIARAADQSETALEVVGRVQAEIEAMVPNFISYNPDQVLVSATDFASTYDVKVDWALWGIIQRGGNGIVLADGKTGKSLLAIHLALHLATGTDWLGLMVPRPMQIGLISREDDPGETARRIASFVAGCSASLRYCDSLDEQFWLSTRAQMPTFMLDNKKEVREIIEALKYRKVELCFFDVFRSMWAGDENDAKETSTVLEVLRGIQREVGCSCVLLHHLNKGEALNPFQKARGSTAIQGWWEWGMGISILNQEDDEASWVRQIRFQTKAARAHSRMTYKICGAEEAMRIELCEPAMKPQKTAVRRKPSEVLANSTNGGDSWFQK